MHITIIGNGITGITTARHIRKRCDHQITVISNESDYFFSRTALMYVYMGHMRFQDIKPYEDWFWKKNRIELKMGYVNRIEFDKKLLHFKEGASLGYDKLVLATGSKSNKFGWPGQDLKGVQGLYHYQDLENMETYTKGIDRAVVVGGGLIGIEMVEMLLSRQIPVTFLVRESSFWNNVLPPEESELINRHIKEHHVDLRLSTELKEILPDEEGRARAVLTTDGEEISCRFVGLAVGVHPNVDVVKDTDVEIDKGILVNEFLETNLPDVYAAGDCAQFRNPLPERKPVEQVWYTGKIQAEAVASTICGKKTKYDPGVWFNSAKFFDIEYQTYGTIPASFSKDQKSIYWEHKDGRKCIRILYSAEDQSVAGFNTFGIRYRHAVCDKWINEKTHIETVLENLSTANFDAEISQQYESEVIKLYNERNPGRNIKLKRKRGIKGVLELFNL